ncbi:MAG: hypothetical protein FWG45_05345 [Oscillospiraceae bacterium]|nr:hypothetical protein [Oscillospiraceae bacterium]
MRKCSCNCKNGRNRKAPIATVAFGGALICFCFISPTLLVVTVGLSLIVLGIWLLRNC